MANNIENLKKLEAEAMLLLDKKRALQSSIAESEANIAESTAGAAPAKKEPAKLSDKQIAYFKDLARVKSFTDLTVLNEEIERSNKLSDRLEGSNDQIYLTAYINMLTSHKVDLEKVAAAEKKAQEEAKKNAVNEEIEALRKELLAARVELDAQQQSLVEKMKSGEKLEGLRAEYSATRARAEEILARINAIDPEISALAAATLDAKKGTKGKKGGELAALVKEKDDLTREYAELDKKMIEVGKAIHTEKGFIPYNEADKEIVKKDRELDRDFEFRKERKEIFEKLNDMKKAEAQFAIAAESLAEKYKEFVDKDGNLIKDPKDMSEEEKAIVKEYLADKKKLDENTQKIRAGVAHFENEKNLFMNRFVAERGRGTTKADLEAARKSYMDAYTAHYSKMNGFKKYGINLLKRLGIAKGEVGMPQDIKDKKAAYYKQADSVMEKAIARLRDEGKTEAEVKKISEKYKAIYYNFTQLSAETQRQNAMRVDAFSNDKKFFLRKIDGIFTGENRKGALARSILGAGVGILSGGSTYLVRAVAGIAAGMGMNELLKHLWKEEKNAGDKIDDLNRKLKLGEVTLADFDIQYRKIQQSMNAQKAIKKAIVTGTAMGAASLAGHNFGGHDTTNGNEGGGTGNEDGGGAGIGDKDPGTSGPDHPDATSFKPTEVMVEKGHGAISLIDNLKSQIQTDHPDWFDNTGHLTNDPSIPDSVHSLYGTSSEQFAIDHHFWNPSADTAGGNGAESALIPQGATAGLDADGNIYYHEPGGTTLTLENGTIFNQNFEGPYMDSNGPDGVGHTSGNIHSGDKVIDDKFFNQPDDSDFGPDKTIDPKFFEDTSTDDGLDDLGPEKPIDPQFLDDKSGATNQDVNVGEKSGATNQDVSDPDKGGANNTPDAAQDVKTTVNYTMEANKILDAAGPDVRMSFHTFDMMIVPEHAPDFANEVLSSVNNLFGEMNDNGEMAGGFQSDAWNQVMNVDATEVMTSVENASGIYSGTEFDSLANMIDNKSMVINGVEPMDGEPFGLYLFRTILQSNPEWIKSSN